MISGKIVVPSVHRGSERDLLKPLGNRKRRPDFYKLVTFQHGRLTRKGDRNQGVTMAQISRSTASRSRPRGDG